jgi:hypothetical protein
VLDTGRRPNASPADRASVRGRQGEPQGWTSPDVRAPNLVKVPDDLKFPDVKDDPPKEVALLNYYFFFPAHEETSWAN